MGSEMCIRDRSSVFADVAGVFANVAGVFTDESSVLTNVAGALANVAAILANWRDFIAVSFTDVADLLSERTAIFSASAEHVAGARRGGRGKVKVQIDDDEHNTHHQHYPTQY